MPSWPPPPDLASIADLVRAADPECFLEIGCPADEYSPEEDAILAAIGRWDVGQLTAANLVPVIEAIWRKSFAHDEASLARVRPRLLSLAAQIEHFFGPAATPQVRAQ